MLSYLQGSTWKESPIIIHQYANVLNILSLVHERAQDVSQSNSQARLRMWIY